MKCGQCGFEMDVLPDGTGEVLCPQCGKVLRKAASGAGKAKSAPSPTDTATGTHLKIAKTVNVGFGDFASVLAAADASRIITPGSENSDQAKSAPDRTGTTSASTLTVAAPDDDDDDIPAMEVYDEDDEYSRIQAEISARQAALEQRSAELDAREKHLNKKLDELIAEKEFLRSGIEKSDLERASYLKQKEALDAKRTALEQEFAARESALNARNADLTKKSEALSKKRRELEDLRRELDTSLTGDRIPVDATTSSVSIPYSAKLLRMNNKLERTVRIQKRILVCLVVLVLLLVVLLFLKDTRGRNDAARVRQDAAAPRTDAPAVHPDGHRQSLRPGPRRERIMNSVPQAQKDNDP